MDTISNYKNRAIATLSGNWGAGAVLTLIYCLVVGLVPSILSVIIGEKYGDIANLVMLAFIPLIWAFYVSFLRLVRGTPLNNSYLFQNYTSRIFTTELLEYVYVFLWTLLLIIPGIVKVYSYSMTSFILLDDPDIKNNAAIEKSMDMMQGHKIDLFLLDLSFIGWMLLCCLTLGIGTLWLEPYMCTAHAHFYEDLKQEYEARIPVM